MSLEQWIILSIMAVMCFIIFTRFVYLNGYRNGYRKKVEDVYKLKFKFTTDLGELKKVLIKKNHLLSVGSVINKNEFLDSEIIKVIHLQQELAKVDIPDR